jgi:photosystem II stability/assembly factor-like uncharacterized protein
MTDSTIIAATWDDGLVVFAGDARRRELPGRAVKALARDRHGGALAIVDGGTLCRRSPEGEWTTIVATKLPLACSVAVGGAIYVGTDDARVLRVGADGHVEPVGSFDAVPGRETWYAGSALIDGKLVGPPLGVRSMSATSDATTILVNVHVGGVPRSTDGGVTWQPTIDVDSDVHEVCAHPIRPGVVIAAAAIGLCVSRDGGATWTVEQQGLHAPYCSAVAFSGDDILVAASADHFAAQGAIYRRPIDGAGSLVPVGGGLPRWIDGIADTGCIAARETSLAVADGRGNLYASQDAGRTWSRRADGLPPVSGVLVV